MFEPMKQAVELWVVAADRHPNGVPRAWILSRTKPGREYVVTADSGGVHATMTLALAAAGFGEIGLAITGDRQLWTHSTSWREDDKYCQTIITYLCLVDAGEQVLTRHPDAMPFSASALLEAMEPPPEHGPNERPAPRDLHVLLHGIGHAADRIERDSTCKAALAGTVWEELLQYVQPELAGELYLRPGAADAA